MKHLFSRIPIPLILLILSAVTTLVVFDKFPYINLISQLPGIQDRGQLLGAIFTMYGLVFLGIQVQKQWATDQFTNEYMNQSDFEFRAFGKNELIGNCPTKCNTCDSGKLNLCNDDHWFDITNMGKIPAMNLRIALIHEREDEESKISLSSVSKRWMDAGNLYPNNTFQYKLPEFSIPSDYYDLDKNSAFYVLLEYSSLYSGTRYKRCHKLEYAPTSGNLNRQQGRIWHQIRFFSITLKDISTNNGVSFFRLIKGMSLNKFGKINRIKDWMTFF